MAGRALADIGDPAAPAILEDAKQYREDIARAYHAMQAKTPVVPLKNGTWVPADPSLLGCYGNVEDFLPGEDENRTYVYSVELGAHHLVANEVLDPASQGRRLDDRLSRRRPVSHSQELESRHERRSMPFDWGGFAKMQPYYCRIAEIHALRDDVKPFIRSYFNVIPALVNFEDLTFWEDMGVPGYASGAWNKTHETGWFLGQTRIMFVAERGDELVAGPLRDQPLAEGRPEGGRPQRPDAIRQGGLHDYLERRQGRNRSRRPTAREMHGQEDRSPPASSRRQADAIGHRAGQAARRFRSAKGNHHLRACRRIDNDSREVLKFGKTGGTCKTD